MESLWLIAKEYSNKINWLMTFIERWHYQLEFGQNETILYIWLFMSSLKVCSAVCPWKSRPAKVQIDLHRFSEDYIHVLNVNTIYSGCETCTVCTISVFWIATPWRFVATYLLGFCITLRTISIAPAHSYIWGFQTISKNVTLITMTPSMMSEAIFQ